METQAKLTPEQLRAWRGMVALHAVLLRRLAQHLQRDSDLSPADIEVLVHLSKAPEERLRSVDLGMALMWEKSRLSKHLSRMEARGLVSRRACQSDSRSVEVMLTANGRQAFARAEPQHMSRVIELFIDALTPEQIEAFAEVAESVVGHVAQMPSLCGKPN